MAILASLLSALKSLLAGPNTTGNPIVITLLDDQQTTLRLAPKDGAGNSPHYDSPPIWSEDTGLLKLAPSVDGLSCAVAPIPGSGLGTCTVTVKTAPQGQPIGAVAFAINPDYATVGILADDPSSQVAPTPSIT